MTGRYLSPEPMLQDARWVLGEAESGHVVSVYGYARNNPVKDTDPDGLWPRGELPPWVRPINPPVPPVPPELPGTGPGLGPYAPPAPVAVPACSPPIPQRYLQEARNYCEEELRGSKSARRWCVLSASFSDCRAERIVCQFGSINQCPVASACQ